MTGAVKQLENLIVMAGARYRMRATNMWAKYEATDHDLYVQNGVRLTGIVKYRGPHHAFAYFTVREVNEDGGYVDRFVAIKGAQDHRFAALCLTNDVVFTLGSAPLLNYVDGQGAVVGTTPLLYLREKEAATC